MLPRAPSGGRRLPSQMSPAANSVVSCLGLLYPAERVLPRMLDLASLALPCLGLVMASGGGWQEVTLGLQTRPTSRAWTSVTSSSAAGQAQGTSHLACSTRRTRLRGNAKVLQSAGMSTVQHIPLLSNRLPGAYYTSRVPEHTWQITSCSPIPLPVKLYDVATYVQYMEQNRVFMHVLPGPSLSSEHTV